MNASNINPLFHDIDLSTTTGIKIFNNAIIGLDDKENYNGIQDRTTSLSISIRLSWLNQKENH